MNERWSLTRRRDKYGVVSARLTCWCGYETKLMETAYAHDEKMLGPECVRG